MSNAAAARHAIVLLHGWGTHSGVWTDLAARLGSTCEVLTPDLPGHGASTMVEPYEIETLVDQLSAAAPPACMVAGWSLGGQLALVWARRHPQQVRRLVLIASTPRFVSADDWPHGVHPQVLERFAADLAADAAGTLRRFLLLESRGDAHAHAVARTLEAALAARPLPGAAVLASTLSWLQSTDLRAQLPQLTQPALVLHGDRDQITPVAAGSYLAANLPQARMAVIEGAAHTPFLSSAHRMSTLMAEFCNDR